MPPIRRKPGSITSSRRRKIAGSSVRPTSETNSATSEATPAVPADPSAAATTPAVEGLSTTAQNAPAKGKVDLRKTGKAVAAPPEAVEAVAADEATAPEIPEATAPEIPEATAPEIPEAAALEVPEVAAPEVPEAAPVATPGRLSWRRVAVLGAAAVLLAAFAAVAAWRPGTHVSNTAYVDIAATSEVADATRSALDTLYAYAPDNIDQYPDRARSVLTEGMRGEFDETVDVTVSAVKQSGTSTAVHLTDVGVKVLDGDRAELVVNMIVSAEENGVAQGSASGPLIIRMEKVGGVWLLSDIADQ
ncbi:mammalian cell entry protein [Rhodococcus spongiicola]|uniref:mammalian cell entry protein n=1 Tax=Rhodococcus spongiicola TaxID=2487352 RepID=UPI001F1B97AD|nr:mammalian cell entry protein [Rhodococcus spongiicola]